MGLSSYGDKYRFNFDWLLKSNSGDYCLNTNFIKTLQPNSPSPHKQIPLYNDKFTKKMQKSQEIHPLKLINFILM